MQVLRRHAPFMIVYSQSANLIDNPANEVVSHRTRREIVDTKYWLYKLGFGPEDHTLSTTSAPNISVNPALVNARAYLDQGPELFHTRAEMRRNREKAKVLGKSRTRQRQCRKEKLDLDLAQIGWQHTIIAPKTLPADYCTGECRFPLARASHLLTSTQQLQTSNPSNHALLQSVLHESRGAVPAVPCAASRMDSLTLLFFDRRDNVVLKTFPRMVVKACGCV